MENEISIAYSKDKDYWLSMNVNVLNSIDDLHKKIEGKKIIDCIYYVCFVSDVGIYIETDIKQAGHGFFSPLSGQLAVNSYVYRKPGPDILEYLCEMKLFGRKANAKMWYCAFKYSLENKDCIAFWEKYKHTMGGIRFMSLILGQKETLDSN